MSTINRLYMRETPPRSHLYRELTYLKARETRRLIRLSNQTVRDRYRWQRAAWARGIGTCFMCHGTGEVGVMGDCGEYEGYEDCWVCQPSLPDLPFDPDERPF